jgi:hypothetical protein
MVFKFKVKTNSENDRPFWVAVNTSREDHKASQEALEIFKQEYDEDNYSVLAFSKGNYSGVDIVSTENGSKVYSLSYTIEDESSSRLKKITELVLTNEKEVDILAKIPSTASFKSLIREEIIEIL